MKIYNICTELSDEEVEELALEFNKEITLNSKNIDVFNFFDKRNLSTVESYLFLKLTHSDYFVINEFCTKAKEDKKYYFECLYSDYITIFNYNKKKYNSSDLIKPFSQSAFSKTILKLEKLAFIIRTTDKSTMFINPSLIEFVCNGYKLPIYDKTLFAD